MRWICTREPGPPYCTGSAGRRGNWNVPLAWDAGSPSVRPCFDPEEDESWLDPADYGNPPSGLRIDMFDDSPRYYRMLSFSCQDEETVPDPANPAAFDYSVLTPAIQFPCAFGGGPTSMVDGFRRQMVTSFPLHRLLLGLHAL